MFELTEDQQSLVAVVRDFANEALAPNAAKWDETRYFPVDVLSAPGAMGMGGIYAQEQFGGSGPTRSDAVLIFEELATAERTIAAYISEQESGSRVAVSSHPVSPAKLGFRLGMKTGARLVEAVSAADVAAYPTGPAARELRPAASVQIRTPEHHEPHTSHIYAEQSSRKRSFDG